MYAVSICAPPFTANTTGWPVKKGGQFIVLGVDYFNYYYCLYCLYHQYSYIYDFLSRSVLSSHTLGIDTRSTIQ